MNRSHVLVIVTAALAAAIGAGLAEAPGTPASIASTEGSGGSPGWLPKGCRLVEIGPANAGYSNCTPPKGMKLPNGYAFVHNGPPKVHATTGASG